MKTIEEKDMQIKSLMSKLNEIHGGESSSGSPYLRKEARQEFTSD